MEDYPRKHSCLVSNLRKSKKVDSFDQGNHKESETLASCFLDVIESSSLIKNELVPKLMSNTITEDQIEDVLLDIGEEFRHILYHIKDSKYYSYLHE